MPNKTEVVYLRLDAPLKKRVESAARKEGVSAAEWLRRLANEKAPPLTVDLKKATRAGAA